MFLIGGMSFCDQFVSFLPYTEGEPVHIFLIGGMSLCDIKKIKNVKIIKRAYFCRNGKHTGLIIPQLIAIKKHIVTLKTISQLVKISGGRPP